MRSQHAPVLIVGAGLAGLSTALFLGHHGVPAVLVDRHPGTSRQPKSRGQMPPIMEAFRAAGVADDMLAAAPPGRGEMTIVICDSVTGQVRHNFTESFPDFSALSPAPGGMASQQRAEAVLAARATQLGADLRFNTRLESFDQDQDGVRAVLTDLAGGREYELTADHLVAADGHRGTIAAACGIDSHGRGGFGHTTTVLFAADLADRLPDSAVLMYYVQNPRLPGGSGAFVSTDTPGEYVAGINDDVTRTDAETRALIHTLVGDDRLEVRLLGANTWEVAHRLADRITAGRVHLVGDAAHLMPPTGGQGGGTALLDGMHLAWKLAAVVHGQAGDGLLAGHDAEHRPYGQAIADWQYANLIQRQRPDLADGTQPEPADSEALMFGYCRPVGAFVGGDDGPMFRAPAVAAGLPGSRAPHVVLQRAGAAGSTRDLFFNGFVLLSADAGWPAAAASVADELGLRLDAHHIGGDLTDPDSAWPAAYGLPDGGAVLVRPDGVVAWRTAGPPDTAALREALRTILDR